MALEESAEVQFHCMTLRMCLLGILYCFVPVEFPGFPRYQRIAMIFDFLGFHVSVLRFH